MCVTAWLLIGAFFVSLIPFRLAWREMKLEVKRAREIQDRAEARDARARAEIIEMRAKARKERDQWKLAKMASDAIKDQ